MTAGPAGPAVAVEGLRKAYGSRPVLEDVSFAVPRGSLFALLGPNGAGKTTTVEILEGYRRADAGTVRVLGLDPSRERATLRTRIGLMLQEGGIDNRSTPPSGKVTSVVSCEVTSPCSRDHADEPVVASSAYRPSSASAIW